MIKNEQDIVEPMIRHTARLVDCMVILDNASVDDTRRIVIECARELQNIVLCDSGEFAYVQSERMTRLLHYCQTAFFADYILLLDADEFLGVSDRSTLLQSLEKIPAGGLGYLPWQTFVIPPGESQSAGRDPPASMRMRRKSEEPLVKKVALRLDRESRFDWMISQGNHDVVSASNMPLPTVDLPALPLLHFPVRSRAQIVSKAVVGWMAYLGRDPAAANREHNGYQWRQIFEQCLANPMGPSDAELAELSMRYGQTRAEIDWGEDAVPASPPGASPRHHSVSTYSDPLEIVAKSWARSLSGPSLLLDLTRPPGLERFGRASETSFDASWHWDNLFVDVAPFRFIHEKHQPATVLDVGCGIGAYLSLFKRLGAGTVRGIDGVPKEAVVIGDDYLVHDLAEPFDLGEVYDMVVCVEVAEHLPAEAERGLLDSISSHAGRIIIFSAAEPGQPGHGHINCRPIEHWLQRWARRGWFPDLLDSLGMRSVATLSWFRRNLLVLRRGGSSESGCATDALIRIGRSHSPGITRIPAFVTSPFRKRCRSPPRAIV